MSQSNSLEIPSYTFESEAPVQENLDPESAPVDIMDESAPLGVDSELLQKEFRREEAILSKLVADGIRLDLVKEFMNLRLDQRKSFNSITSQLANVEGSAINIQRVQAFSEASAETRETAIHLTTFRPLHFSTFPRFHEQMRKRGDVELTWIDASASNDNNNVDPNAGLGRIAYRRGAHVLELDPAIPFHELGRRAESLNVTLGAMFADLPFKPQIRVGDEMVIRVAAQMCMVAKLDVNPDTQQYFVNHFSEPVFYRPNWKAAEVPIPTGTVAYLKKLWNTYFKQIQKGYRIELGSDLEYVVHQLYHYGVTHKLQDRLNVPFTRSVEEEYEKELLACLARPDLKSLGKEIQESNAALSKSRGFRGAKPALDDFTHSMFEARQVAPMGSDPNVSHARVIGQLFEDLREKGAKGVVVYDINFPGKLSTALEAALKADVMFPVSLRAQVLHSQKPGVWRKSEGKASDIDVHHETVDPLAPVDALVWLELHEAAKADKTYLETHEQVFERLKAAIMKHRPRLVYFGLQLAYLNPTHPLADIVAMASQVKPLPDWSRGHNAEAWFQLTMEYKEPKPTLITAFNAYQVVMGRQSRVMNYFRDFLISGGHVLVFLGTPLDKPRLRSVALTYCFSKRVVESAKVVASTWKGVVPAANPIENVEFDTSVFSNPAPVRLAPERESRPDRSKTKRDERSPSVSSSSSGGSGKSWADQVEEEEEEKLARKKKDKVAAKATPPPPAKKEEAPKPPSTKRTVRPAAKKKKSSEK